MAVTEAKLQSMNKLIEEAASLRLEGETFEGIGELLFISDSTARRYWRRWLNLMEDENWLFIENTYGFEYDKALPYVVVGVDNDMLARFADKLSALMFVLDSLKRYGRIIDTIPKNL